MEQCSECGKKVNTQKGNCVQNKNGSYRHKHCPKIKNIQETSEYMALKDRIQEHFNQNAKGYILQYGINWFGVSTKIKKLKDQGYSYEDQLYALDEVVKQNNGFWGYGSVERHISRIIYQRDKKKELDQKYQEKEETISFSPKFDLGEDLEW